jgi:hypothetical protein
MEAAFSLLSASYGVEACDVNFDDGFIELEEVTLVMHVV